MLKTSGQCTLSEPSWSQHEVGGMTETSEFGPKTWNQQTEKKKRHAQMEV